jgi:tRNA (guanine37-N1)-methyltransferase
MTETGHNLPFRVDVFTLFPELVDSYCGASILGRARDKGLLSVATHNIRDHATDSHRSVDDAPFGGGAGMVMMPGPIFSAVEAVPEAHRPLILLSPAGTTFSQSLAQELASGPGFSVLCGRYEGVDERVVEHLVDQEVSLGDFVLAGGELAALVVIEAVARLRPGVLGNDESSRDESFSSGLLEYPQYTRPAEFRGWGVPEVLRSGDHAKVAEWQRREAIERTQRRRPDLLGDG